jgi:two-component system, cell cycle response regulator
MTEQTSNIEQNPGTSTRRYPCLVIVRGLDAGRVIPLDQNGIVLGRGADVHIRIEDEGVSRQHARFCVLKEKVLLEDLKSTNGVWCNRCRIKRAILRDGDCLQFGKCLVAFRLNHPEEGALLKTLYRRATRDPLTGLYNRTFASDRLTQEVERHRRYHCGLSVIQLDLDHFKQINDAFGHATGDKMLSKVARVVQACLRSCDLAARIGGEEILVVLPETSLEQARSIAEKIRMQVESLSLGCQGRVIKVTASFGVVAAEEKEVNSAALVAEADAACYRAKKAGRNRVM